MKISDVKIGGTYETKIGSEIVRVRVLAERKPLPYADTVTRSYGSRPTRFLVARTDNGRTLPKTRTAASLRPCEARFYVFEPITGGAEVRDRLFGDRRVHFSEYRSDAERVCASLNETAEEAPIAQAAARALGR